ncbi:MAG: ABC transporter permease, partial [Candidatus Tectomicrobia bacterium]|nr:ABC transporter permease [Candidatus Tectomicrobia bacterium]
RYACVIGSGALAGLAGAFLSLGHVHVFVDNITQGKGYIALAVVILGRWRPVGALLGALIFGGAEALQFRVHTLKVPIPEQVPVMLPYVLTIIALVGSMKKTRPPAEDGIPYIKEGS